MLEVGFGGTRLLDLFLLPMGRTMSESESIEVTAEMIEAGLDALDVALEHDGSRRLGVERAYRAMVEARERTGGSFPATQANGNGEVIGPSVDYYRCGVSQPSSLPDIIVTREIVEAVEGILEWWEDAAHRPTEVKLTEELLGAIWRAA